MAEKIKKEVVDGMENMESVEKEMEDVLGQIVEEEDSASIFYRVIGQFKLDRRKLKMPEGKINIIIKKVNQILKEIGLDEALLLALYSLFLDKNFIQQIKTRKEKAEKILS